MNAALLDPGPQATAQVRRFAFKGRVSTEDYQDPEASRNWQISRSRALIEPAGGIIVAEYFDIGQSRSLPWARRPQAAQLLADLANPGRGFDAVVIGEPQRAFYGNQYSLTMPVFTHYGVELWVPEVGGPIDPDSEAHDLIMSVFGGMSKGERNRIKIRVRAAMAAQAAVEGRFLGGRPPYGYRIADAGPHPNPAKAADGKRLHKLEPDPQTAWVVRRIFAEYLAGRGLFAIAEGLTRDAIPSPSQNDAARNPHRSGEGWAKSAVRAILRNPRYTGRQVWNKQRKDEILLDVNDVARGYETRLRWNNTAQWVWSEPLAQEPLVCVEDFEAARAVMADASRRRKGTRETRAQVRHPYVLRGRLYCGYCGRKMQGQYSNHDAYYRCRYPKEYALASHVCHPGNVYLREADVLPAIDTWLAVIFAPHRLTQTIRDLETAQAAHDGLGAAATEEDTQAVIAGCDVRLARYQAALDAGADPQTVAGWTRQVKAERAAALARDATQARHKPARRLTEDDIRALITALGDLRDVIRDAEPAEKAATYDQLGLRVTLKPGQDRIRAEVTIHPENYVKQTERYGAMGRVRGASRRLRTSLPSPVSLFSGCSGDRPRRPVDPVDHDWVRGAAGADCGDRLLPSHASAGGIARSAGLGGGVDAVLGGRDDRGRFDHAACRLALWQPGRDSAVNAAGGREHGEPGGECGGCAADGDGPGDRGVAVVRFDRRL
jgi:site-specific DNA recombinase